MNRRTDVKAILADPVRRRELWIRAGMATQHREGIPTTCAQMAAAYDKVRAEPVCPKCHARAAFGLNKHTCWRPRR